MKKIILLLSFSFLMLTSVAQSTGKFIYSLNFTTEDPEQEGLLAMFNGSTITLSFAPNKSKLIFEMGAMGKVTTIVDIKKNKVLTLEEMMGSNAASFSTIEEAQAAQTTPQSEFTYFDETKQILGFTCKKATSTDSEGNITTFWYTEDLKLNLVGQSQLNALPGVTLEFSTNAGGTTITYMATQFDKSVSKQEFNMKVPEGFEMKTTN